MKKIICLMMLLCLVLSACTGNTGTSSTPENSTPGSSGNPNQATDTFTFTYQGTAIAMHGSAESIVAALGEPTSYTEEPSCAFDGMDKTYYYGSFYLQTYPLNGGDFVYSLWFMDDTISTPENIYIGATQAQVEAAYGTDCYNGSNAFIMTKGASTLTILMENGAVSSIIYDALLA